MGGRGDTSDGNASNGEIAIDYKILIQRIKALLWQKVWREFWAHCN